MGCKREKFVNGGKGEGLNKYLIKIYFLSAKASTWCWPLWYINIQITLLSKNL
jgi:hypothetical protein